jgi:hypothetical protein
MDALNDSALRFPENVEASGSDDANDLCLFTCRGACTTCYAGCETMCPCGCPSGCQDTCARDGSL